MSVTAASLISLMAQRLMAKHRGLDVGGAAEVIYQTWSNLCSFTEAWKEEYVFSTVVDEDEYAITVPYAGVIVRRIDRVRRTDTLQQYPYNDYTYNPVTGILKFRYESSTAETNIISARMVLKPLVNNPDGISTTYFQLWDEAIYAGAMSELYGMGNKPWYDQQMEKRCLNDYEMFRGAIRSDVNREGTGRPLQMQCPNVFA